MSIIEFKHIDFSYDKLPVLKNLSVDFEENKTTCILGSSGSGKTTILRLIAGLEVPGEGEIFIDKKSVSKRNMLIVPPDKRMIGYVFQDLALWPHFSTYKNIAWGLENRKEKNIKQKVSQILEFFDLEKYADKYPHQLSGGQQQMVAIARALVLSPKILLMDEPLANLDVKVKSKISDYLHRLKKKYDLTIIYVTHDHRDAFANADNIIVINNGKIEASGTVEDIKNSKNNYVKFFLEY